MTGADGSDGPAGPEGGAARPVALVTGSSSGIGAAIATRLAAGGMRVVLNSARSQEAGERLAQELPGAVYVRADIADPDQAAALVAAAVRAHGRLDVLVNNAGTTRLIPHQDLAAVTPEVWREILDVNLLGTWHTTVAALPHLRAHGDGCVVNISSVAGSRPAGSCIPYAVSKAAVEHLTRLLAAVTGPEVRVNALAPGLVETGWTAGFAGPRAWMEEQSPLRRVGTPEDIAESVYGLVRARFTTGAVVLADGGTHLR